MERLIFNPCDKDIKRDAKTPIISRANPNHLPCASCGSTERKLGTGKGPHTASLKCGECNRVIKWIGKYELAKIENQGGHR
jgi:hypothetical protein